MGLRKISFAEGEYYHLYNRGVGKQKIFHDKEDYKRFAGLLFACNSTDPFKSDNLHKNQGLFSSIRGEQIVSIGAYCLMPNHFHILITQASTDGISVFMRKLTTAYVMYYNKKYERTGRLFENKFKAEHADTDRYLKYLFSYIHLNPIKLIDKEWKEKGIRDKKKALMYLAKYENSSYLDFKEFDRPENMIVNVKAFPGYFSNRKDFDAEIFDWLTLR